jgi:hypothetical protein
MIKKDSFNILLDKKLIVIIKEIGSLDFYREIMKIFGQAEFMSEEMPVIEKDNVIYSTGHWKFKNSFFLVDQEITHTIKSKLDRYPDGKFI